MKKTLSLLFLLLCFDKTFAQEKELLPLLKDYGIPGIQLVCIKGNKVQNVNLGVISKGSDKKVTSNTVFEAASLSKCVFAYIVMRLYDRGIIDLDKPLVDYFGSYDRFDPNDPRYAKITARMVMRHTTGLPNWGNKKYARLIFTPDSTFSYSGEGFQYLQRVVEKLMKKPLNDIARQEVFTPLGMTNSSYTWMDKFDTLAAFGNGLDVVSSHQNQMAAASLLTCAHDYAIFLQALINGKGLKPETQKMMFATQSNADWFHHNIDADTKKHVSWGLGLGLQENETGKWIWHWGDNGDFKAFYIANPEKKEILVYFTYSTWGLHITTDVLNTFFPKQTWWPCVWTGYQFHELERMKVFRAQLEKQGYEHATEIAEHLKQKDSSFKIPEDDINDLGFILMRDDRKKEAVEIFRYNLSAHPGSATAYDSLAEGYEADGEKDLALKNFKKAYELNPKNDYAAERIKDLESQGDK
ncbi:serine hydrolase [Mucilaginibacter ginsenosidivorans]|uniref:Serine hydrolase n=1 Tax=Mucilaginibacter ginsenosidivorans TaxID=398053 RepID=A0A5B8UWC7_9SPHI|nr:serine hydrolase [Mucilaginibacter ginsenosidivorans]QEC63219.1 serine hydrolase [Mucilaginibacter ginsenosidivorans]